MLSFESGQPIAVINGGIYDKKVLHIKENIDNKLEYECLIDNFENVIKKLKIKMNYRDLQKIKNNIANNYIPIEDEDLYLEIIKSCKEMSKKQINIYDGIIQPIPKTIIDKTTGKEESDALFIAGPRGVGKSTFCSKFANIYKTLFPNNKFFVFSRVQYDPVIDNSNPIRIMLNDNLVQEPIKVEELSNSLVLFDDIDNISGKENKLASSIRTLRDEIFENGRHYSCSVIASNHTLLDYRMTKKLLQESGSVVIFPHGGYRTQILRFLKDYVGISNKEEINKIFNLPSRWVLVSKRYPMYILHEKGCYLIK